MEVGISVWNYYQLYFALYCCLTAPFPFLYSVRLCLKVSMLAACKTESRKTIKHVCLKTFLIVFYKRLINSII